MEHFREESTFTINGGRVTVTLETARDYISFTGVFEGGGQIDGRLREQGAGAPDIERLCDLWDTAHLKQPPFAPNVVAAVEEARALLVRLDGSRIGAAPGAADDFEEASFSNSDDVIDSRDVITRIEYLRDWIAAAERGQHEETIYESDDLDSAKAELTTLEALESEADGYASDWRYGQTLIRDDYFEDYARQFAEDIGAVKDDVSWPYDCIDWEKAARQLQMDYTSVEFGGVTYWVR